MGIESGRQENLLAAAYSRGLCSPFIEALPIDGASMSVFSDAGQSTICATDQLAARSEALQFELGEGPHWQARNTGLPVLCPDLSEVDPSAWPMYFEAAHALGIVAIFAFPMIMGAVMVGVVDLYALRTTNLEGELLKQAKTLAGRAAPSAVLHAMYSANDHQSLENEMAPALRREVHQATGMIQAQLDLSATDAFLRLRSHAFAIGRPVVHVARDVVSRRIDFSSLPD